MVSVSGEDKTSLLLHHNLNDDHQLHIALLASSKSIQVGFIISQSHINKASKRLVHREAGTHIPELDPRDTWVR